MIRRGAIVALLALSAPPPSVASQYPLEQAHQIIPRGDGAKLKRAGLRSTLDLLTYGRTAPQRAQLASSSGLPVEKIAAWVALADLMRVRGIGPDVARLLTAAGVRTLASLQAADPNQVAQSIHELNAQRHLSNNPPGAQSISYWIAQARLLPVVLDEER